MPIEGRLGAVSTTSRPERRKSRSVDWEAGALTGVSLGRMASDASRPVGWTFPDRSLGFAWKIWTTWSIWSILLFMTSNDGTSNRALERVAELHLQAAEAARRGDFEQVDTLTAEAARLRRIAERARRPPRRRGEMEARRTSIRSQALAALDDIGVPSPPREIAGFHLARFGTELDVRGLASVRRDERKAFDRYGPNRPAPYLVPALDTRLLQPVRGPLTLSSWQLERRLLAPTSSRVDHLRLTRRVAELVNELSGEGRVRMLELAARYAQSVISVNGASQPDPVSIIEATDAELDEIDGFDEHERASAARRARRQLKPDQLLWGWEDRPGFRVVAGGTDA